MPEVGVLNLTIQDNSAKAAGGLSSLSSALIKLQTALGDGLKLSGIAGPLNKFANTVSNSSKTLSNIGAFLNAVSSYQKAFKDAEKVKFNAQPIKDLKEAVSDGIKLGQAGTQIKNIREALEGTWNTDNAYNAGYALTAIGEGAKSVPSNLGTKATQISKLAAALNEYADATNAVKAAVGSGNAAGMTDIVSAPVEQAKQDVVDYEQVVNQMKDLQEETKVAFKEPLMPLNLQLFAEGGETDAFEHVSSSVQSASEETQNFNVRLKETKDILESIKVNPFEDMYQSFSKLAQEYNWFRKEGMRLTEGNIGSTPDEFMLSTYRGWNPGFEMVNFPDKDPNWKPNWVMDDSWKENMYQQMVDMYNDYGWFRNAGAALPAGEQILGLPSGESIIGEGTVSAVNDVVEEIKDGAKATQAMAQATVKLNSELGKTTNYFKGLSLEDIYNGTREKAMGKRSLMSEWLHGNGTENEQAYAIKQVAQNLGMSIEDVKRQVDEWNGVTANMNTIDLSQYMDMSHTDLLTMKMNGMQDALMRDIEAGKLDQQQIAERTMVIQNLRDKIQELTDAQNEASGSTLSFGGAWQGLKKGIEKMFPTLSSMVKRLGVIAKYRFIRSVIKHITSGFSEGIQNVYEYSKAVGGSFAPAMDSAATAIAQMKNSLGAALAPAIQALIPILNTVVNWFITLVNYVNQFFALLNGQATWTRALPATVNAFDKQKKAAKGAGAAIKDLLADWDELNIIQSESNGGGVGSAKTAEDYLKMFEEVGKFDNKIKDTVKFIQDNMNDVIGLIKDAGIALLGWKFAKAFTGPLAAVGALIAAGKIMEITWKLTGLFDNEFIKTGDEGWIIKDAMVNMFGAFLAGTAIETVIGGGTGIVTAGVTLVVSGGISYGIALANAQSDKAEMLKQFAMIKTGIGLAAMGVGFGIATGSAVAGISLAATFGIPMFVLSAAVTTVVQQLKTAKQIAKEAFTKQHPGSISIEELYDQLNDELKRQSMGYSLVIDAFAEVPDIKLNLTGAMAQLVMLTGVIRGKGKLTTEEAEEFKQAWQTVFESLDGITGDSFDTVFKSLNISLTSENEEIRKQAEDLRISWLMYKNNMTQSMAEMQNEMDKLVDKVAAGKASKEELEQYQRYVEELAKVTDTSFDALNATVENAGKVNFKDTDNLTAYLDQLKEAASGVTTEIDEGVKTGINAIKENKRLLEFRHAMGWIGEEEYNAAIKMFEETEKNINEAADDRKTKVQEATQNAYNVILKSALQGLNEIPYDENGNPDMLSALTYIMDYIEPIVSDIENAGGTIDKDLEEALKPFKESSDIATTLDELRKVFLSNEDHPLKKYLTNFYGDINEVVTTTTDPLDKFVEDVENFEHNYGAALKKLDDDVAEYFTDVKKNLDIIGENTFGDDYTPDVAINPESPIEVPVQITITPIFDSNELYQQIRDKILNSDMPDTSVPLGQTFELWQNDDQETLQELRNKIDQVGITQAFDMLTNFLHGDGWTLGKIGTPNIKASIPTSTTTTTGAFLNGKETVKTEPANPTQDATNVETGVRRGNSDLVGLIRDLIDVTRASNNRPINVTVSPSSLWGFHTRASNAQAAAVTGNEG